MFRSTTVLSAAVAAAFMAAAPAQADSTRCAFDFAAAARGRASGLTLDRDRTPGAPAAIRWLTRHQRDASEVKLRVVADPKTNGGDRSND